VSILKKHETGIKTSDLCREYGISEATFYNWQAKYGGMTVRELKRMKELEAENARKCTKKCVHKRKKSFWFSFA